MSKHLLTRYRLHTIAYTYTYLSTLVLVYSSIAQSYIHLPQEQVHLNTLQTTHYIHTYILLYLCIVPQLSLTSMYHKSKYLLTRYRLQTIAYTYTYLYTLLIQLSLISSYYYKSKKLNTLKTIHPYHAPLIVF